MKVVVTVALVAISVGGCSGLPWVKDGATQQDLATDTTICENDASESGAFGWGMAGDINTEVFNQHCLMAHGWRLQKPGTAPSGTTFATDSAASVVSDTRTYSGWPSHGLLYSGPTLGIVGWTVTASSRVAIHMNDPHGVFVSEIVPDGPAEKSGIKLGDVIQTIGGRRIDSLASLNRVLKTTAVGSAVDIEIDRNGHSIDVKTQL